MMETYGKILVKLVVFTVKDRKLLVFLPKGKLPIGELNSRESLDRIAEEIFKKAINIAHGRSFFEQLYTFSYPRREKVEVDVAYYFLIPGYRISPNDINNWSESTLLPKNIQDKEIIEYAILRLRWKIEYTNVVYSLLPSEFAFSELQSIYEAILGRALDKRNFRKKLLSLGILKETGHIKKLGKARPALPAGRPAEMFSFKDKKLTFVKIL